MAVARSDMAETIIRCGKALVIHALVLALALLLVWLLTSHYTDANDSVRSQYSDPQSVASLLDIARGQLFSWSCACSGIGFLAACLFIGVAQRRHPASPAEGGSQLWLWVLLFLALLLFTAISWYPAVYSAGAGASLTPGSYLLAVITVGAGALLGYFLATALTVTLTMKPSVPLAGLLPTFWN